MSSDRRRRPVRPAGPARRTFRPFPSCNWEPPLVPDREPQGRFTLTNSRQRATVPPPCHPKTHFKTSAWPLLAGSDLRRPVPRAPIRSRLPRRANPWLWHRPHLLRCSRCTMEKSTRERSRWTTRRIRSFRTAACSVFARSSWKGRSARSGRFTGSRRNGSPRDPDERLKLARWCLSHRLNAEAKAQLLAVLELSPGNVEIKNMVANIDNASTRAAMRDEALVRTARRSHLRRASRGARPGHLSSRPDFPLAAPPPACPRSSTCPRRWP